MTLSMIHIFVYAAGLFLFCFAIHILVWRTMRPVKQIKFLYIIFGLLPGLCGVLLCLFTSGLKPIDWVFVFLLYYAISVVYIQTYPPIQAGAPSLQIVRMIGQSGQPVTLEHIQRVLDENTMIYASLQDLVEQEFIKIDSKNKQFILLPKGKALVDIFIFYRKVLGLEEGAG
jgi:hypothetical protein